MLLQVDITILFVFKEKKMAKQKTKSVLSYIVVVSKYSDLMSEYLEVKKTMKTKK